MFSQDSMDNGTIRTSFPTNFVPREVLIERLEARRLLSATAVTDPASLPLLHAAAETAPSQAHPATAHAVHETAAQKHQARIARLIAKFNAKIAKEILRHPALVNDAKFQRHIAVEKTQFAKFIARMGGTYTPTPFSGTPVGTAAPPPASPTLTGAAVSPTQINLTWTAPSNATGYKLEVSPDGGTTWSVLASPSAASYSDVGLSADTAYEFRVSAIGASGISAPSAVANVTTLLTPPTNLAAAAVSSSQVNLTWTGVTDATSYLIERSLNNTTWTSLVPSPALTGSSNSYTDHSVASGTTYYYRLSAIDAAGTSAPSTAAGATTIVASPVLTSTTISTGEIDLSWTAITSALSYKLEMSANGGATWSTLATQSGTTFANTGLSTDTAYRYRVSAANGAGTSAPSAVVIASTLLNPPTGLGVVPYSTTEIDLAWTPVTDATSYKIERSLNNTVWTTLAPSPALTGASAAYADTGLLPGTTYYYRISSIDAAGTSLPATAVQSLTLPAAPVMTGTVASATQINLSWPAVTGAASYLVETSTDGGNTWSTLASPTTLTYSNTGLTADSGYKYRVSAVNATGTSATSNVVSLTTLLTAPTGFTVAPASATQINLAWTPVFDATSYKIERSADQVAWTALVPSPALTGTSIEYSDATVLAGTTYYYRLSSIDAAGTSAPATVAHALTVPATPVLTGTVVSASQINLSWATITGAASYKVETSTDGGNTWTTLANPTTLTYSNTGLTADTAYKYRVSAVNATGASVASSVVSLTTLLAAPTGLAATTASTTEIDLAWNALTDATNYKIERSLDQTTWTTLVPSPVLTGSSYSYADTSVSAGTTYYYRISAIDAVGTSTAAAAVHALTLPVAPVLTGTVFSAAQINLSWPTVASATSYKVEMSADNGNTWTVLASPTTLTYSNTGLTADTAYKYRVSAINATGTSAASSIVTVTTLLTAPTGLAATATSATQINLSWTPLNDATNYKIERSLNQTTWTALVASPALTGSSASYSDTTAAAGTTYYYRISAIDAAGTSTAAAGVHALTMPAASVLSGTVNSAAQINLAWTTVPSATSYLLETSADGGITWTTLASPTTTTYSNTGLSPDTAYKYRVSAINGSGTSVASNVLTLTTMLAPPSGFVLSPASATEIDLAWTAVPDATTYKIERSTNNTTWTTLVPSPALTGSSASYADTTVTAGTSYYYRISATNAVGTSAASAALQTLTLPAGPVLTATVASPTQINLSWAVITSATSYKLETSSDSGNTWTTLASPTTLTYSNTGLSSNINYKYRLSAINASGTSAVSPVVTISTLLLAPPNFAAAPASATSMTLTWTAVSNATSYKIERSLDQTTWSTLVPSPALTGSSATYTDATASAGTTYYYRISSINAVGASTASAVVHGMTLPVAPVLAGTVFSATQINLSWAAIASATSYKLETSLDGGTTWTTLASPGSLTFSSTGLTADTSYEFRDSAVNTGGTSLASNVVTLTTLLNAPAGFTATPASASTTEVALAWTAVTHATNYKIERSTDDVNWTALTPSPALTGSSATYADTTAVAGTAYFYRISSIDAVGTSAPSAVMTALTLPATPTLTATTGSATQINLSWTSVSGAATYKLESSADGGTTWTTLANSAVTAYSNTGLTADTSYQYRVSAVNATGTSTASSISTISTLLAAPAGFTATAASASSTEIDLAWTAVTHATNYKIERSLDQNLWTTLAPSPALTGTSASYADTGVLSGLTYYYRISAIGAAGTSAPAAIVHALSLPAVPTLTAVVASATQVNLSWPASFSATSYLLETSTDGGTTWTTLASPTTSSYSSAGLTADTSYKYRVSATNATGTSPASTVVTQSTLLAAPTGFTATAASASPTEVDLAWTAVTHATGYKIERSLDNLTWTTLAPSPALTGSSASYADTTASAGTTYYYRISAIDAVGTSAPAAAAHALTLPASPTLTATVGSASVINLSWTAARSALSYLLETSVDGGTTWTTLATPSGATYSNSGLTADTSYKYRVSAVNSTGNSAASSVSTITTLLAAPMGFSATAASASDTEIDLAWTAVTHATNFKVERSLDGAIWTALVPSPALTGSSAAYADTGLSPGTAYYYRLSAIDAAGTSASTAAVNTLTLPATPTLTATVGSATTVNLNWTTVKSAATYLLETSADGGTTWTTLASPTTNSYLNTGLTADTSYQYRVSGTNASGNSAASTVSTLTTLLAAPAGFTATAASASPTEIDLAWTAVTHATNYKIERSLNQTQWTTLVPSPALTGSSASYADTTVSAGTTCYYRISAIDAAGTSAPATVAHALTLSATPTLTATPASATQTTLSWTPSIGATSYLLGTSTDGGTTWTTLASPTVANYSSTGLTADTSYKYRVSATNATGTGAASAVSTVTTFPPAPSGFTATAAAASSTEIDLAWTAFTHATGYLIERSLDNTSWTTLTPSPALTGSSAAYADTSVSAGTTYYYRISSIDAVGTSAPATAVHALTLPATPVLTATVSSATQINLIWSGTLSATSYLLETSTDGGTTWTTLATPTTTSYSNSGLTADTSYKYRLSPINATGTGVASSVVTLTTLPAAPAGFAAAAASASSTEIDLTWTAVVHATSYKIERSLNQTIWTVLAPSPALTGSSAAYADTALASGTTYYYRISAIDPAGTSAPAAVVHALTRAATPTLSGVVISSSQINLSWNPVQSATSYLVESTVDGGTTWATLASPTTTVYSNTGLSADANNEYRVSAINSSGNSLPSSVVTLTTILGSPTGLGATAASATEVDLAWTAVTHATNYKIERSLDNTTWTTLTPSPALTGSSASYADTSAAAGTTYYYRISAIDSAGTSVPATAVSLLTPLVAPTGLAATAVSATQINLSWTRDTTAGLQSYLLQGSADGSTGWSTIESVDTSSTSASDVRLTTATTYYYRLIAVNAGGNSAPGAVAHATTM